MQGLDAQIEELETRLRQTKLELARLRASRPPEEVKDYSFADRDGRPVSLSELFGDRDELILVHNMGRGCSWCTMWADGFSGVVRHLEDRAAFAVTSPDPPEVQRELADARRWRFRMLSVAGTGFVEDMGFRSEEYGSLPGVSAFVREPDGRIVRTGSATFDAGDDYCAVWHLLALLPKGADGWEPSFEYPA